MQPAMSRLFLMLLNLREEEHALMLDVGDCGLGGSSCQSMLGQDIEPLMSMMHPLDDGNTKKCV